MKILVVDDDLSILESIQCALESQNYQVVALSQGKNAHEKAKLVKPDLIILDYLLSGITGYDISKQLHSDNETKNIPIIMISAHPEVSKSFKTYDINRFLAKPFELDQLLQQITELSTLIM
jgi:two-component system alkaline phosphatase synthesis response regulator PhoP